MDPQLLNLMILAVEALLMFLTLAGVAYLYMRHRNENDIVAHVYFPVRADVGISKTYLLVVSCACLLGAVERFLNGASRLTIALLLMSAFVTCLMYLFYRGLLKTGRLFGVFTIVTIFIWIALMYTWIFVDIATSLQTGRYVGTLLWILGSFISVVFILRYEYSVLKKKYKTNELNDTASEDPSVTL
jgi:hypothetical protein